MAPTTPRKTKTPKTPGTALARRGRAAVAPIAIAAADSTRAMNSPFADTSLMDVMRIIRKATLSLTQRLTIVPGDTTLQLPQYFLANPLFISRAFIAGDHWQGGYGWLGPRPQVTDVAYTETMGEIARAFVSKNVIAEVTHRHVSGVVGIEPHWGMTGLAPVAEGDEPTPETVALIDECEALLTSWWDRRKCHELFQEVAQTLLYAGRAMLRLYVPRGMLASEEYVDATGAVQTRRVIKAANVEEALEQLWVEHPLPENSAMALDEDTREWIGVILFRMGSTVEGNSATQLRAEVTFLAGDDTHPVTILRSTDDAATAAAETVSGTVGHTVGHTQDYAFDFGGRLPTFEALRDLFVTPQMWQAQRAVNLALSMIPRTNVQAGFLERTIFNAQMPGAWVTDPTTNAKKFVPDPFVVGAGTTNVLQGTELRDPETGKVSVGNPSITYKEPSSSQNSIDSARAHYSDLLEEAAQEHTLAYTNARASGKTHEQARADFTMSLRLTQARLEPMGRWLLETLLVMAEAFGNQRGRFTNSLRAYFECRLDTGPVTLDERKANNESVKVGTLSVESAIVLNGESDPDAELERLAKQPGANLSVLERQAIAIQQLTAAGATLEGAATMMGVDPELVPLLVGTGVPPIGADGQPTAPGSPTSAGVAEAVTQLTDAIALHTKHMNGTEPSTGAAGAKSREEEMAMLQAALAALTGGAPGAGMQ